jgi:AbrB family looped-hinge helix DNA binding protein
MAAKSKSQKMRELAASGMSRADIARKLGVRYQFVRNVLEREQEKASKASSAASGFAEGAQSKLSRGRSVKVRVGPDGRIVVPAAFREALTLKEGDVLFARLEGEEVHLLTARALMKRVNAMVREFVPEGVSLVDELLEDRRREVEREKQNG